ncbi:MAG TPA: endo alpha-1,4 polygalactosaminidase [Kofleriaceae bacterium]|nr:endo alpha-1,4 polygalactosaminidase [Kofleriaceae bacterium]
MRSVTARSLALGLVLLAGCKPEPFRPDAGPIRWSPKPGEILDWDIQLARTPFDVSTMRAMYMIDLFDAVPAATMLDYGDGAPLTVPAGAHATAIAQLHATTPPTIVVCHVNSGAIRLTDPDAIKYPGYEANPPNRQTLPDSHPAPGSVIGWSTSETDSNERFIDMGDGARDKVLPLVERRIELAKRIGCDAIAANLNDAVAYESTIGHGFDPIKPEVLTSWATEVTKRAHDREISIGVRNSRQQTIDAEAPAYDWALVDRCGEYDECDKQQPFINRHKAVFAIDYDTMEDGSSSNTAAVVCGMQAAAQIAGGIIKTAALDSSYRMPCP